jgi:hypothetical protein
MDPGPVSRSVIFQRVMRLLDIEVITHLPKGKDGRRTTVRSKGKVERPFLGVFGPNRQDSKGRHRNLSLT